MLSAGDTDAPTLITLEYMPESLRSRTGSREQHLGPKTATVSFDMNNWNI